MNVTFRITIPQTFAHFFAKIIKKQTLDRFIAYPTSQETCLTMTSVHLCFNLELLTFWNFLRSFLKTRKSNPTRESSHLWTERWFLNDLGKMKLSTEKNTKRHIRIKTLFIFVMSSKTDPQGLDRKRPADKFLNKINWRL